MFYFCIFFSHQDIENFKAEIEKRQQKESTPALTEGVTPEIDDENNQLS